MASRARVVGASRSSKPGAVPSSPRSDDAGGSRSGSPRTARDADARPPSPACRHEGTRVRARLRRDRPIRESRRAMAPLTAVSPRADGTVPIDVPTALRRPDAAVRTRGAVLALGAATAAMAASAFWLGITSAHVPHPVATAVYSAYLVAAFMIIGLCWWLRRPASRFGPLLMSFGAIAWVYSWESADAPLLFDLGVLVEGPLTFATFY